MPNDRTDSLKRENNPASGRLIVFQSMSTSEFNLAVDSPTRFDGFAAINFPAMPDTIDLVRRADYNVSSPWGFPDGIHFYKGTSVLEIPFTFKIHTSDRAYCPDGGKTLLQVAAALQSLVMPIGSSNQKVDFSITNPDPTAGNDASGKPQAKGSEGDVKKTSARTTESTMYDIPPNVFAPATCYLELIVTERNDVGIACVGYVKETKVTLGGPWMRGQGIVKNIPSWGEFGFTFVHHPGHVNGYDPRKYEGVQEQQAYAGVIKSNLYNTVNLLTAPSSFVGIEGRRPG